MHILNKCMEHVCILLGPVQGTLLYLLHPLTMATPPLPRHALLNMLHPLAVLASPRHR